MLSEPSHAKLARTSISPAKHTKPLEKPVKKPVHKKATKIVEKPVEKPTAPPLPKPDYHLPPIENGMAPVITNIPTAQPVVFLTIDDGNFKDPNQLQWLRENNLKVSLFLTRSAIAYQPEFFTDFQKAGYPIENHTISHDTTMVFHMPYEQMKQEICGMSDYILQQYGKRPELFRPPGGSYNDTMRKAVADCGMKAVVTWIAKVDGGGVQYQIGESLRPGDIVLMHFRPLFHNDLAAFIGAQNQAGLHTELLENWLVP